MMPLQDLVKHDAVEKAAEAEAKKDRGCERKAPLRGCPRRRDGRLGHQMIGFPPVTATFAPDT